jgi:hypothetical protein
VYTPQIKGVLPYFDLYCDGKYGKPVWICSESLCAVCWTFIINKVCSGECTGSTDSDECLDYSFIANSDNSDRLIVAIPSTETKLTKSM